MDNIWDRKSFEVGGHWLLWRGWKKRMTTRKRQKSNAYKNTFHIGHHYHEKILSQKALAFEKTPVTLGKKLSWLNTFFFFFFFSFDVIRSGQSQRWTLVSVWGPPHVVSDEVSYIRLRNPHHLIKQYDSPVSEMRLSNKHIPINNYKFVNVHNWCQL